MQQTNGLDFKIKEMAARIRELRELEGLSVEDMALKTDVSIDEYVKMMETERSIGHEQLNAIWNEEVEAKKTLISEAEARIAELQKELQEKVQFVQTMNGEIATSSNKCTTNRVNFDHTVDFIVKNLNDDKSKLSIILN